MREVPELRNFCVPGCVLGVDQFPSLPMRPLNPLLRIYHPSTGRRVYHSTFVAEKDKVQEVSNSSTLSYQFEFSGEPLVVPATSTEEGPQECLSCEDDTDDEGAQPAFVDEFGHSDTSEELSVCCQGNFGLTQLGRNATRQRK